jgi:hypothetical protein
MASSRWKRFAFFERQTLSLPAEVYEDLFSVEETTNDGSSERTSKETIHKNERVSMIVTTAALPVTSRPKLPIINRNIPLNETDIHTETNSNTETGALEAMWASLTACTLPENSLSTTVSPQPNVVTLHSQGRQPIVASVSSNAFTTSTLTLDTTATVDGLVLVFASSQETHLIHCFDVTARCNPSNKTAVGSDSSNDSDGWRGSFAPFRYTVSRSKESNITNDRIVGMASCRSGPRLFVVCASEKKLTVVQDPHLHLSCRRFHSQSSATTAAPDHQQHQLNKQWDLVHPWGAHDGTCRVVDIVAGGMVAVGTTAGAVLVFCYNDKSTTLRPYLRIPPPFANNTKTQVASVTLALGEDRASVFCTYQENTGGETNNTTNTSSSSASAGVCCYEMALPTGNNSTASAPSARHDLDGRHVGSSSLVDSSTTHEGVQITVVRSFEVSVCVCMVALVQYCVRCCLPCNLLACCIHV